VWGPKALKGVLDITVDLDVDVDQQMARREGVTEKYAYLDLRTHPWTDHHIGYSGSKSQD
jgi:hypothetical protein